MIEKKKAKIIKPKTTKDIKEPQPVGRPSKYKPEYCDQLIQHMSEGLSFESFAAVIDVNRDTLYQWDKDYEEFSDAIKRAKDKSQLFWEKMGIDNIMNQSEFEKDGSFQTSSSKSLNATIWIFNMKNRFKWRDKQPDESDVVVNNYSNVSDQELDEKLKRLTGGK